MLPVSLRFPSATVLALLASLGLSSAGDIIKLKSGEKLDGVILSESPTEVVIEIQLGKGGIKDQKKVPRKDISEVIKATPDQIEAAALAKLVPTEDGMSDASYQKVLTEKLEPFLKKYPASAYKKDVEALIKTYKEEMEKAKGGSIKVEGAWVTAAEREWNQYNFEARLRRVEMDKLLKAGKLEEAYAILADLEANKSASVETVKAITSFKAAIPEFERTIDRLILEQPINAKAQQESIKTLSPDDKKRFDEAIKAEQEAFKLRLEEARKAKFGLLPYDKNDLKSLADAKTALAKESARLNKIDIEVMKTAANTFQTGLKNFAEKAYLSAQRNFEDTAKVFQKDTFVKERVEVAKKAAAEAARANAEAGTNKPVVAPGTPAAATDAKKPDSKTSEPAKTEGGAPVKKAPAAAASEEAKTEADAEETKVEEPASNMPIFLIAGAAALLVILLIVKSISKKKAAAADE